MWVASSDSRAEIQSKMKLLMLCDEFFFIGGWLVRVTLVVDGFYPKILGPWWGPMKAFCSYVNGHWVGTLLPGGGDT